MCELKVGVEFVEVLKNSKIVYGVCPNDENVINISCYGEWFDGLCV